MPARRIAPLSLAVVAALVAFAALLPGAALGADGEFDGSFFDPGPPKTIGGTVPQRGMNVVLMAATPGAKSPIELGSARSVGGGEFEIHYRGNQAASVKYLLATRPGRSYRLGIALGEGVIPQQVKVTERTTVAMGFVLAQFLGGDGKVAGKNPGLKNAAAMSGDLVNLEGGLNEVLRERPNGSANSTEQTFNSLADLLTICRHQDAGCKRLLSKARTPGGAPARDTLEAVTNIARNPWHDVQGLYKLALSAAARRGTWQPSLAGGEKPAAWTLALSFEGSPPGLDGPGNFAIDPEGNLWVANNYAFNRHPRVPACGSDKVFRFTPTGQTYPGSPYVGGGLSGVGFGVAIDPSDKVWLGNFGFEGKGCETEANHYSLSKFSLAGEALSPATGFEQGEISWPQGTVADKQGNIWLANCGNDSVTEVPGGEPESALNIGGAAITAASSVAFERPFADALDAHGNLFVTGNASNSVAELSPSGKTLDLVSGGGLHLPMGDVVDGNGYVWVSNSKWVVAPCPGVRSAKEVSESEPKGGGDITLIRPNGRPAKITGAGLNNPWGITVDGDDHVWVANFGGQRLSELCGSKTSACPPGKRRIGAAISPKQGYAFDGLVRNTGVIVDPSGNVWLANNWKNAPIQTNPGGYQIVAYLGLGTPVKSPAIGPPRKP